MRVLRAAGIAVAAVVSVLFAAPAAGAATCNFTTPIGGTWEGGTWSCGHVPTAGDDVVLDSGDNVTVSTADAVAGTVTVTSSATLTVASLHKLDVSVATVVGAGTLAGPGTINAGSLSKTLAGQLSLDGGVTVRPQLDSSWTTGDICITNGSTLRFEHELDVAVGAGSFNCSSNDSLVQVAQTGLIDVAGGTRTWFSQIDDDG
jgi:hypothetical protein